MFTPNYFSNFLYIYMSCTLTIAILWGHNSLPFSQVIVDSDVVDNEFMMPVRTRIMPVFYARGIGVPMV